MDFMLGAVTKVINGAAAILRGFSFTRNLADDVAALAPYLRKGNALVPIDTALAVISLVIAVQLALAAYYWITRAINLLRGAG